MMEYLLRAVHALLAVMRIVAGILLICSVVINFANIIGRYFFAVSIPWAEEIMLFLMVGCVFLGTGVVSWSNRQIRMDVIVAMLPTKLRQAIELLVDLTFIATAILLVIFAWPVIVLLGQFDERSQAANFPLVIPQAMIPIGLSLIAFLIAVRLISQMRSRGGAPAAPPHH
jgi:TRAP-type C4-dicarboxylate transport system permease small subunit